MIADTAIAHNAELEEIDEQTWYDLYIWLLPLVGIWVRDAQVSSWRGQHDEVAEDIAHEAVTRAFRYHQRSYQGEMPPIGSLRALVRVIARNYFRDLRKKDWCLVRPTLVNNDYHTYTYIDMASESVDAAQIALDQLILDSIIVSAAQIVVKFPLRQKMALLTDLANMSDIDGELSRLEQAFSSVGVCLSDYKRARPQDSATRSRDAALRSIAYKRLRQEFSL